MTIKLRSYQIDAINETMEELKKSDDPVLFVMSVGGGKSICLSVIAKKLQEKNKRVLCLVNSSELVRNNSKAFESLGVKASVFCSSLSAKDISNNVIFATPQSVISAIKKNHLISDIVFNLIIVDEAHGIAYKKQDSTFMRILRHYKQNYPQMRLLGLSGTPFRLDSNKNESIVGEDSLFKKSVANITTEWLIKNGYLVKPYFGYHHVDSIDMSAYHIEKSAKSLNNIIAKNKRLTYEILQEVQIVMQKRNGAFIFCSTIPHCFEALEALPKDDARIIIGSTPDHERNQILNDARNKKIKYLISVSCLLVGIDVPYFCTAVFLRPTKSLTLFVQAIGRSLRLHPEKKTALVLDYAQNLEQFQDFDNPIINDALQPQEENEKDYVILCHACKVLNTEHARRCIGVINGNRCEHYFEFKDCPKCQIKNDKTSRYCRGCDYELIDPNSKLKKLEKQFITNVKTATYNLHGQSIFVNYVTDDGLFSENYSIHSERSRNIFYAKFVRLHLEKPSQYYIGLKYPNTVKKLLEDNALKTPDKLVCEHDVIKRKIF